MDQVIVVSVDRWSLYRGAIALLMWFTGQPVVVLVNRWSLCRGAKALWMWFTGQSVTVIANRWSFYTGGFKVLHMCIYVCIHMYVCTYVQHKCACIVMRTTHVCTCVLYVFIYGVCTLERFLHMVLVEVRIYSIYVYVCTYCVSACTYV